MRRVAAKNVEREPVPFVSAVALSPEDIELIDSILLKLLDFGFNNQATLGNGLRGIILLELPDGSQKEFIIFTLAENLGNLC